MYEINHFKCVHYKGSSWCDKKKSYIWENDPCSDFKENVEKERNSGEDTDMRIRDLPHLWIGCLIAGILSRLGFKVESIELIHSCSDTRQSAPTAKKEEMK